MGYYSPNETRLEQPSCRVCSDMEDLMQVFAVRSAVYIAGQNCPYAEEFDGNDFTATHIIADVAGEPAGTLRLRYFGSFAKVERAAVRKEFRGLGIGEAMMNYAIDFCRRKGFTRLYAHAQQRLVPYWGRCGFHPVNKPGFHFSEHDYVSIVRDLEVAANPITEDLDDMILVRPEGRWDEPGILEMSLDRPVTNPN